MQATTTRKIMLAALVTAALGAGASLAVAGPGEGREGCDSSFKGGQGFMERMSESRAERHEQRLDTLKLALQLKPNQQDAWKAFEAASQRPDVSSMERPDRDELAKLPAPERLEKMLALKQSHQAERQAHMQSRLKATQEFYGQLNPEQRKVFDELTPSAFGQRGGHRDERHGHHGMRNS